MKWSNILRIIANLLFLAFGLWVMLFAKDNSVAPSRLSIIIFVSIFASMDIRYLDRDESEYDEWISSFPFLDSLIIKLFPSWHIYQKENSDWDWDRYCRISLGFYVIYGGIILTVLTDIGIESFIESFIAILGAIVYFILWTGIILICSFIVSFIPMISVIAIVLFPLLMIYRFIALLTEDIFFRTASISPKALALVAKKHKKWRVRSTAYEQMGDIQSSLAEIAKNASDSDVRKAAVEKLTDQSVLACIAKSNSNADVRIVAIHRLVEYDIEEDLRMDLIRVLGNKLKNSYSEVTRVYASEALMAFYKRYRMEEIEKYNGTHIKTVTSGYSEHTDHTDTTAEYCRAGICNGYDHTDYHIDDSYSYDIKFNTEDTN
jgi:hypothetical protein